MACRKRNNAVLIPDNAGIIRAEKVPVSTDSVTFRDVRETLFNSALYVEQCAREYIDNPPPEVDPAYIDAMQYLIETGKYLRSLVDDEEINNLPVPILEKIWGLAVSAHFAGRMEELAGIAPILSKEQLTRELFAMTQEGLAAAAKDRDQKARAAAEKLGTLQETIEDRNRQRWERWATVPDCIKAVKDMVTMERQDGKNIASPGNNGRGSFETLRINVSAHLKKAGKRRRGSDAKPYYQTADIAEAIAFYYKAFTATQYLREFEHIEMPGADILDGEPKREELAKKNRGISED